jgi:multidrug efflux pump subunit AcrA (membrane-fusion protein)
MLRADPPLASWRAILLLALSACGHDEAPTADYRPAAAELLADGALRVREDSLPFIEVQTVGDAQVPTLVRAPARLAFREGAASEVGAPVEGRVTEVHARVGEHVEAGDPLVTISSPSAASVRGELARARVLVQAALAELARQEQMRAAGVAEADEEAARAGREVERGLEGVGRPVHDVAKPAEHRAGIAHGVVDVAPDDVAHRVEPDVERGRDAEVRAGAPQAPEEVVVRCGIHVDRA